MGADRPLIVSIVGTRPEGIKMAPVILALDALPRLAQSIIPTGQHDGVAGCFDCSPGVRVEGLGFNPSHQSAGEICSAIRDRLRPLLARIQPRLVLVQGDTSSALAGALAAWDCAIPLGHVEAGLRSFDLQQPWPEEGNRVAIDELSDLLFAPTDRAMRNLKAEPRVRGAVFLTGNSGIDALFRARDACPATTAAGGRKIILATCHRRENRGADLADLAAALKRMVRELPVRILFLLHPNPHVRAGIERLLGGVEHIHLHEPVDHAKMVALIVGSWLILTDSGGLQEEGPALGKPVLVLRNVTERGEAAENIELVGMDRARIFGAVARLLADEARYRRMAVPTLEFGDGHAGERIAAIIERYLADPRAAFADAVQ